MPYNEKTIGKASIEVEQLANRSAKIIISTRDFEITGTITIQDGILTWGGIKKRVEEQLDLISSKKGQGILSPLTDESPHSTRLKDSKGNKMVVPAGFGISSSNGKAENVAEGIIIQDSDGNQFVWVPVGTITKDNGEQVTIPLGRYSDFSINSNTGKYETIQGVTENNRYIPTTTAHAIRARLGRFYEFKDEAESISTNNTTYDNTKAKDIQEFVESAVRNGGFYIARYEAGISGTTSSNTSREQGGIQKDSAPSGYIVSQANKGVWNYIRQSNAAIVCRNMYTANNPNTLELYVTSDLMNSYAWDTAIIFIQQCGTKTNSASYASESGIAKTNSVRATGTAILKSTGFTDVQCNIYDMAGNIREWTTESYTGMDGRAFCCSRRVLYYCSGVFSLVSCRK